MARHPLFTDQHDALRTSVRSFVESELQPLVADWERDEDFPGSVRSAGGTTEIRKELIGRSFGL